MRLILFLLITILIEACSSGGNENFVKKEVFKYPHSSDSLLAIYRDKSQKDTTRLMALKNIGSKLAFTNSDSSLIISNLIFKESIKYRQPIFTAFAYSLSGWNYTRINKDTALYLFHKEIESSKELNDNLKTGDAYYDLAYCHYRLSEIDSAVYFFNKANQYFNRLGDNAKIVGSYNNSAEAFLQISEYDSAIAYFTKAYKVPLKGKLVARANAYNGLGNVYYLKSDYRKALEYYLKSLAIDEEDTTINYAAVLNGNIGLIYLDLKDYKQSLKHQYRSLKYEKEAKNSYGEAACYSNIGIVYETAGNYDSAIIFLNKAMDGYVKLNNLASIAETHLGIGSVLIKAKRYTEALKEEIKAIDFLSKSGKSHFMAIAECNLAQIYVGLNDPKRAYPHAISALKLSDEMGLPSTKRDVMKILSEYYLNIGDKSKALETLNEYIVLKDSLSNAEMQNEITRKELGFEFDKKTVSDSIKSERKITEEKIRHELEIEHQRYYTYGGIGGFILMLLVALISIRAYRQKKHSERLISIQKEIVEEKQQEILDSISYAKRIQEAILPKEEEFLSSFEDSFVLFIPKDIVSGDFYWIHEVEGKIILAVGDCTGHGVPGGFMSMLGNSFLNEIVIDQKIIEPAAILNVLRDKVIHSLKQTDINSDSKDGMDIVICCINKNEMVLSYAAANNNFILLREGQLTELKADKMPIGYQFIKIVPFSQGTCDLKKNDSIFIYTDGYADQFGGEKRKKFRYANFQKILLENENRQMQEISAKLKEEFLAWKGNLDQIDDICVIGVKI